MDCPGPLRFSVKNSVLLFQPKLLPAHGDRTAAGLSSAGTEATAAAATRVRTLRVDLRDGSMGLALAAPLAEDSPVVLGILGMLNLHGGSVIALATKAKQVGQSQCAIVVRAQFAIRIAVCGLRSGIAACSYDGSSWHI